MPDQEELEIALLRKETAKEFEKQKLVQRDLFKYNRLLAILDGELSDLELCVDCRKKNKENIKKRLKEMGIAITD